MALVNCPECGNNVSDKADKCIHCGFPLKSWCENNNQEIIEVEIPQMEVLTANFKEDYVITYDNGKFKITQYERVIYDGDVSDIKIYGTTKKVFNKGILELYIPKTLVPRDLHCLDEQSYEVCKKIKADYDIRVPDGLAVELKIRKDREERERVERLISNKSMCPWCQSLNVQVWDKSTYGARDEKTKQSYSLNLNPLKPFTVLNKKEKVVRKASDGITITKYRCGDCGKIFQ